MSEVLRFEVLAALRRDRLDKLVVGLLASVGQVTSRAEVQRWIEHGRVQVDGQVVRASAAVPAGAWVEVRPEAPEPTTAVPDASIELRIAYEDEHLLVVDKQAGLVVHPARGHASGTLVNALLGRGGFERAEADESDPAGHLRPGIVHRLDKDTSGLLVVAKDALTREALQALFARHAIDREYVAIVVGAAVDATYSTLHGRHPTDRLRFTTRVATGKHAVTHVRVVECLDAATLVACTLETGRTHQIRVHLAEHGQTPVLADALYGRPPKDASLKALAEELGRQALHARVLGFVHPTTGQALRWESAMPPDMARVVERLRALAK